MTKGMPFVRFEVRAVEDRAASLAAGEYRTRDVDYIILVPAGSAGKLIIEEEYESWLRKIKGDPHRHERRDSPDHNVAMQMARFPDEWIERIESGYKAWKEGQELPLEGTPIKLWPVVSPSQRDKLLSMHIRTVEELAESSDTAMEAFGMGGITLRQRARDYLAAKKEPAAKVSADMEKLRKENESLIARLKALEEAVATEKKQAVKVAA